MPNKRIVPIDRRCYGQRIRESRGVETPENIFSASSDCAVFKNSGEAPYLIMDLGAFSFGGYPVFKIKSFTGQPVLHISYSDRFTSYGSARGRSTGDFVRGSCKYLGVELPVLPANPGRYEEYTVTYSGEYHFPLIQGQQRFVCIELKTPDSSVELEYFYIYYTSSTELPTGEFSCSNSSLEKLWTASAYTLQLATISAPLWDCCNGRLFIRNQNKGNDAGIHKKFKGLTDYTYSFDFKISYNPDIVSGVCALFRAVNRNSGYVFRMDLDGSYSFYVRRKGCNFILQKGYISPLTDNKRYKMTIICHGSRFEVSLDGQKIADFEDGTYASGSFGFCQGKEKWAIIESIEVEAAETVYKCGYFSDVKDFETGKAPEFVADGAKRDRLPWSGDLEWAFSSGFYAFGDKIQAKSTLRMLSKKKTPDGYIYATFYPEDETIPRKDEYGMYESDMFSVWVILSLFTYLNLCGDRAFAAELKETVLEGMDYILQFIEADGLFNQRYETSKGLWDHARGDTGKHSYTNILILRMFDEGYRYAMEFGERRRADMYRETAERMRVGINTLLYSEEVGGYIRSLHNPVYCEMGSSLAMCYKVASAGAAETIAKGIFKQNLPHGKIVILAVKGLYEYGFKEEAYRLLTTGREVDFGNARFGIGWLGMTESDDYPMTTYECMHFPPPVSDNNTDWGDLSHPDTGVCDILSGCMLGIMPGAPGFEKVIIRPNPVNLEYIRGKIKTPRGNVACSIEFRGGTAYIDTVIPDGVECEYDFSRVGCPVVLNGTKIFPASADSAQSIAAS